MNVWHLNVESLENVYQLNNNELHSTMHGHTAAITCLAIASNGLFAVSGSEDKLVLVWGLTVGSAVFTFSVSLGSSIVNPYPNRVPNPISVISIFIVFSFPPPPAGTPVGHYRRGSNFGQRKGRVQRQGGRHSGLAVRQRHANQLGDLSGHQPVGNQQHEIPGQRRRAFFVRPLSLYYIIRVPGL